MTRFIHLTDLHLSHPELSDPGLHSDTPGTLRRVVEIINAMQPAPDFVVASGDLTNHGDLRSYELVRQILAELTVPAVLALGNHDRRPAFHQVFSGTPSEQPYDHDVALGGLHVITLDTAVPGRVGGGLEDGQFTFLTEALARHPDLPKLLVAHHPPRTDPDGLPWGSLDAESSERLSGILAGQPVIGILSGHIHINQVNHWHGIPIVVSNGQHSTVDLLERKDLRIVEGTGFAICTWRPTGLSVSFVPLSPAAQEITVIDQARLRAFS